MNLYRYKHAITVVPSPNTENAQDRYFGETEIWADQKDFEILVPHQDFVKLFRLARTLYDIEQYSAEDVETLVDAYAKKLGYSLSSSDLWHGILKWVERFDDFGDEDIEDWLN